MERERYPADWERIATAKKEAVGWRCERCGKQCRRPGEPFVTHRNTLTVAHLNHTPEDVPLEMISTKLGSLCKPCIFQTIGCPYKSFDCDSCNTSDAWEKAIRKWMEEEDGTDNP